MYFLIGLIIGFIFPLIFIYLYGYWSDYKYHRFNRERGGFCIGHTNMKKVNKWSQKWFEEYKKDL